MYGLWTLCLKAVKLEWFLCLNCFFLFSPVKSAKYEEFNEEKWEKSPKNRRLFHQNLLLWEPAVYMQIWTLSMLLGLWFWFYWLRFSWARKQQAVFAVWAHFKPPTCHQSEQNLFLLLLLLFGKTTVNASRLLMARCRSRNCAHIQNTRGAIFRKLK